MLCEAAASSLAGDAELASLWLAGARTPIRQRKRSNGLASLTAFSRCTHVCMYVHPPNKHNYHCTYMTSTAQSHLLQNTPLALSPKIES